MKILFITNIPSPYRIDFFTEFGKYCELTVLFEKAGSDERDQSWNKHSFNHFNGIFLKGKATDVDKAISFEVLQYIRENSYDYIMVSNMATPTGMLAIAFMKLKKIPYLLEGDGGLPKNGKGLKETIKKHIVKSAKACFSTSGDHDQYYLSYGANRENIYRYPFTSIKKEDIIKNIPEFSYKQEIKRKLGISEKQVILSVGRFIYGKGYDILLHACWDISRDVGVYLVGGQPTDEYIQLKQELKLSNVHFVGFKLKEDLKEYYRMADLFVLPTRKDAWGLVINEAMAQGLPVITTDKCVAGLALIDQGVNGFIVPVNDVSQLADKMNVILNDDSLREKMAESSLSIIKNYSIEEMASEHLRILKKLK